MYRTWYDYPMNMESTLSVAFFLTESGRKPVRKWLKDLDRETRKIIGEDIKLVQFRWPLGMPLVRKIEPDLWEVRSHLNGRKKMPINNPNKTEGMFREMGMNYWLGKTQEVLGSM